MSGQTASYKDALQGATATIQVPDNRPKVQNSQPMVPDINMVSTLFSEQTRAHASPLGSFKGEPAIRISEVEEATIAEPFKYTLIGKFDWGRPAMVIIRREVQAAGFSGPCFVGLIDSQHVVFRFELETDFQRMWLKQKWSFRGFKAQMFKWTTEFRTDIESPIAPVWINFPLLPLHCFNKKILFALASVVGKPLKTDMATAAALQTIRPSVARVCVEADLTKAVPERVWIGKGDKGMWQAIQIEDKPKYCTKCYKLGHLHIECELSETLERENQIQQLWRQKERRVRIQDPHKPPNVSLNGIDKGKSVKTAVYAASTSGHVDTQKGEKVPPGVHNEMSTQTDHLANESNLAQFLMLVDENATAAQPSNQHEEVVEETRQMETPNSEVEQSRIPPNHAQMIVYTGGNKGSSADPAPIAARLEANISSVEDRVIGFEGISLEERRSTHQTDQNDSIQQNDDAIRRQIKDIWIPITIDFQHDQEAGPIGGEGGGEVTLLNRMPKVPSTSDIQKLQLITTESETDYHQYGGSSEWEEETDSAVYMETLMKSRYKPRKHKTNKLPFPTSSRKLRSHKQKNASGYESR